MHSLSESLPSTETPSPSRLGARALIGFLAYVTGYLGLVAWFKWVDVYHAHFATTGVLVVLHNLCRVLFIFYLFWIVHAAGALVLRAFGRAADQGMGQLEHTALAFFTGAGLWHLGLFGIGYLRLYTVPVALALTLPAVALSYWNLRAAVGEARAVLRRGIDRPSLIWAALVGVFGLTLLVVKGLYPGGGHDYFTHYFHFYRAVVDNANIWPNDAWYEYYYSKGAGLYFVAMLLTDPLAPQLVTVCMMAAAALVLFLFCRQAAPATAWPWVAVALFLFVYIYTPIWGQFEKLHEPNAAFLIATLWTAASALAAPGGRRIWCAAAAVTIVGAVIVNPTIAVYLGAVFGLLVLWYLARRALGQALIGFGLAMLAGLTLAVILAINYVTTGLALDQGIAVTWRFADLERLERSGFLPLVILLHWGRSGMAAESLALTQIPRFLSQSARLDLLYPLVLGGVLAAALPALARLRAREASAATSVPPQAAVLLAAVTAFLFIALAVGRAQTLSFFRLTSFMVPVMIAGAVVLWSWPRAGAPAWLARILGDRRTPAIVCVLTFVTTVAAMSQRGRLFDSVLPAAWQYAAGRLSIDTAYGRQADWPYAPWGAIYPGARGAYEAVGTSPIRSLHVTAYCMLPDCHVESVESFGIGRPWDTIMFGTPEEARAALQASGRNYFLFSRTLMIDDYLVRSPLFSPDNIARYLGIRWTDGTTALLTWLGPDTMPLDAQWLADYRSAVESSATVASFPYQEMRDVFARLRAMPRPWRPFPLAWNRR